MLCCSNYPLCTHGSSLRSTIQIAVSLPFSLISSLDSAHPSCIIKCTFLHPPCKQALCPSPSLALQQLGRHRLTTVSVAALGRSEAKIRYGSYLGRAEEGGAKTGASVESGCSCSIHQGVARAFIHTRWQCPHTFHLCR